MRRTFDYTLQNGHLFRLPSKYLYFYLQPFDILNLYFLRMLFIDVECPSVCIALLVDK